jgi:hypothetical protein
MVSRGDIRVLRRLCRQPGRTATQFNSSRPPNRFCLSLTNTLHLPRLFSPTLLAQVQGSHELGKKKVTEKQNVTTNQDETQEALHPDFIDVFFFLQNFTAPQTMRTTGFRRGAYIRFFNVSLTKRCMPAYTLTVHTHTHTIHAHICIAHTVSVCICWCCFSHVTTPSQDPSTSCPINPSSSEGEE